MRTVCVALALVVASSAGFELAVSKAGTPSRAMSPVMKGKGTRGMPGKAVRPPAGSGMQKNVKNRMQKRDFDRSEWTLVAEKGELGSELGDTKAVEAGMSPQGQNYIWTLIRGADGDGEDSTVWATDGSCRACTFPLGKATVSKEEEGHAFTCGSCGSKFSLVDGEPIEWLPGNGPIQFMAKQLNSNKEQIAAGLLKTRVSRAGRVYVRLPDGTLPIAKTAAQRAAELAGKQED